MCQWWTPFTGPSSQKAYHIDSTSSVSQETWKINVQGLSQSQQWMPFTRPSSEESYHIASMSSVSREIWTMNMKSLPQCHWETAFSRPYFEYNVHINSLNLCLYGTWPITVQGLLCILSIVFQIMPLLTFWHRYGSHIENKIHTAIKLNGHIDPTYLPTSTKIKQLQQSLHTLLTNMCQKDICLSNSKYMQYMPITSYADIRKLCQYIYLTILSGALVYIHLTLLVYAPEQICLPQCTYMS